MATYLGLVSFDFDCVYVCACSAGVGRSGTFITIDIALEQIREEGVVAIYNIVDKLRHQRPHMVQSQVCFDMFKTSMLGLSLCVYYTGAIHVHS